MNRVVYSIGLGPGDPELVTVKAVRILRETDICVVPQSDSNGRSVARDIVSHYIGAEKIEMYYFPMSNDKDELKARYSECAERIGAMLTGGKGVCYVTMGDPTIFSTSNYLTTALNGIGIDVVHIPGITSITAASSRLGLPLAVKGGDFGVYEMPKDVSSATTLIMRHETVVFLKVNNKLSVLCAAVREAVPSVAYLVGRIGLSDERIYNLSDDIPEIDLAYLSLAFIKR